MARLYFMNKLFAIILLYLSWFDVQVCEAQKKQRSFKVVAFYTAQRDAAHISFVHEANRWFSRIASQHGFSYDSTNNWSNLNEKFLSNYNVVIFLDTRPKDPAQREAFKKYMQRGGAWIGFHFAGFALTPSDYPQNWGWYHDTLIGAGQYKGNTWKPTPATLKVENTSHAVTHDLPLLFKSSPNEWYSWEKDLRLDSNIQILLSIDSSSFPLGTGPKANEIWHEGYYPVAWTNRKYNMVYFNMGHNDIDYQHKLNKELSLQFDNPTQNQLIINAILWLARKNPVRP